MIGASGLVGSRVLAHFGDRAIGTYCSRPLPGLRHLDMTNPAGVDAAIASLGPRAIVLAAAYTHVDGCEQDLARSKAVNVEGPCAVARAAGRYGARLVFLSSDYVFGGETGPHRLDEAPAPLNVYGRHKLEAERAIAKETRSYAILRSCNVYGYDAEGKNFVMAVYRNGSAGRPIRVPVDQWGNPTYADDLIDAVDAAVGLGDSGIFHVAGPDYVDRLTWARRAAEAFGFDPGFIEGVATSALGQPARRPLRGGLESAESLARLGVGMRALDQGLSAVASQIRSCR